MKFLIYVICFLPSIIADVLIKEHVSFPSIAYSLFPNGSWNDRALLSGLIAGAVSIMLYLPPFYVSRKLIKDREGKEEIPTVKILTKILRVIGIVLGSVILSSALILFLQTDSVWFADFIATFCDILIVIGFILTLSSVFVSQKHKDIIKILRLSGSSLFVIGLTIFYLYTKLHM